MRIVIAKPGPQGVAGVIWPGDSAVYDPVYNYGLNYGAFYNGSSYRSLQNNNIGHTPTGLTTDLWWFPLAIGGSGGGGASGPAGGDLSGTYPNPKVQSLVNAAAALPPLSPVHASDTLIVMRNGALYFAPISAILSPVSAGGQFNFSTAGNSGIFAGVL